MKPTGGHILHVDLSTGRNWTEPVSEAHTAAFTGGRGVGAALLWHGTGPGVQPLGPDNLLIFGPGLLTGTAAPCSGRTTVTAMSPATGLYVKTSGGGHFGAQLKYAGYSHLVVHGQADQPAYIWIDDGKVEVRDAARFWAMDGRTADAAIKHAIGDEDIQVALIGPGGENLVAFAAVMFSVHHAAARGGAGAVMGSKRLKAVAVRGTGAIAAANPSRFHDLAARAREALQSESGYAGLAKYGTSGTLNALNEQRILPSYNFQRGTVRDGYPLTGEALVQEGYLKGRVACFGCIIGCHRRTAVERGRFAGTETCGPEYETMSALGSGCGLLDTGAVLKANDLCNIYGLDTISAGGVLQWAMECREKGLLTAGDLDGVDLRWGNAEAMNAMIRKIAFREGFGSVLADGVRRAAEQVGGDSYRWAVQAKGLEQSRVDTRSAKAYALAFAVNPRGPDHLHTETFAEFGMSPESRALIREITGDEELAVPYLTDKRAEIVRWHEDCYALTEALGFCVFTTTALYGITPRLMADMFSAFTGLEATADDLMLVGRRAVTLEKCINVRRGADRKADTLPWRMMNEASPDRPEAINGREELDRMLDEYYRLHGWDPATSWPTRPCLEALGLEAVAAELERAGKIGGSGGRQS
ncbi:MAG TPA: aldehyde ferredoxin oxidoreductase family protein [Bacillota bacterium]|nr:aldehyde ferredoxin oxidoreductase family protein [Bacillota bacterium]